MLGVVSLKPVSGFFINKRKFKKEEIMKESRLRPGMARKATRLSSRSRRVMKNEKRPLKPNAGWTLWNGLGYRAIPALDKAKFFTWKR